MISVGWQTKMKKKKTSWEEEKKAWEKSMASSIFLPIYKDMYKLTHAHEETTR